MRIAAQIFEAAALYFAIVFGTGFALGLIRVLWAVPRLGERVAELVEQPFMLLAAVLAGHWIVQRFSVAMVQLNCVLIGIIALGLMLGAELAVGLGLRGPSATEYIESRDPVSGTVYLLMLAVFALMPGLIQRRITRLSTSAGRFH